MSTIKKLLLVAMACVLCFVLVACGDDNKTENNTTDNKKNETVKATDTPTPTQGEKQPEATATPTLTPIPDRDLKGLAVVVGDWWSGDSWEFPRNNAAEEKTADWQEEMMEKYHYTIKRATICGWGDQAETCLLSITSNEPLAQVMTFDYRFIGSFMAQEEPLFADVSKLGIFDFNDSKWNKYVVESMTVGSAIYGFANGKEPRTGIYFNKDLIEKALGAEWRDKPYDLQASGDWTWATFDKLCEDLLVKIGDSDGDGATDVYPLLIQNSVFAEMAMVSNGCHAIVTRNADGKYVNNCSNQEVIDDLNWAYSYYTKGYARAALEGEQSWDFFETRWQEQKCVMIAHDEYRASAFIAKNDDGSRQFDFDWGFVCFPKGPKASDYQPVARENVNAIANCPATQPVLADIAFAYDIFTSKAPEVKDDPSAWAGAYENLFADQRSVHETLDRMINGKTEPFANPSYIVPGLYDNNNGLIQAKIYYSFDSNAQTPAELLATYSSEIDNAINDFNTNRVK